jgi:hypothetical protein
MVEADERLRRFSGLGHFDGARSGIKNNSLFYQSSFPVRTAMLCVGAQHVMKFIRCGFFIREV